MGFDTIEINLVYKVTEIQNYKVEKFLINKDTELQSCKVTESQSQITAKSQSSKFKSCKVTKLQQSQCYKIAKLHS